MTSLLCIPTAAMLKPPDIFHLSAAEGWLGLGDYLEANEELQKITPMMRAHPDVLALRYEIYANANKWDEAFVIAQALVIAAPDDCQNWIGHAYSARRAKNGGIAVAKEIMEKAASVFQTEPTIFFNLACYDSQLGDLSNAKAWLDKAFETGDRIALQKMVLDDPDLAPVRKEFGF